LYENLRDVTLVGHRHGGMVITGVADRVPDRLARLAYIDAFVPEDGESIATLRASFSRSPGEVRGGFIVPIWVKPGTVPPMDVPQPAKTFSDSIALKNPLVLNRVTGEGKGISPTIAIWRRRSAICV
jgi:pimeloyl-ACP methyl ester carboxylesterase